VIRGWLARVFRTAEHEARSEVQRRLDEAIARSKQETQALADDSRELAERIRKNSLTGRKLIGGTRPPL
jgi:hypothetical protein